MIRPAPPIEDYAYLGDGRSGALVSRQGSVDWLCFPRFDAGACFARLLGSEENGHWTLAPTGHASTRRRYVDDTLVLETRFTTPSGEVMLTDALAVSDDLDAPHRLVRVVEGVSGAVEMKSEIRIRFDYGSLVPWVRRCDGGIVAFGGPDAVTLHTPVELRPEGYSTIAEIRVRAGDRIAFVLTWFDAHTEPPETVAGDDLIEESIGWWRRWAQRVSYDGAYHGDVRSSLVVLKGLAHRGTGAFVAAPTTSLPEWIGGSRNWDYRYAWLRDAALTLGAMLTAGCVEEATAWRDWLLRAVAGDPGGVQIMYGLGGERRLPEMELEWLAGYGGSQPVRIGNGAWNQLQLDVYGEVLDALYLARSHGMDADGDAWNLQLAFLDWLEGNWQTPDNGIWEARGDPARYTYSQVMAWVAFDRAARAVRRQGLSGDAERWQQVADRIHREVCAEAVSTDGVFTQAFGSSALDASALIIPIVGFLPARDERVLATIAAIDRELSVDGLVRRYAVDDVDDGVGGNEGAFLLCSFWLVDALALAGFEHEAAERYAQLLGLRNDVGLLAEEYDPGAKRMLGNFPQAFSHIGVVSSAASLCTVHTGPSQHRAGRDGDDRSAWEA